MVSTAVFAGEQAIGFTPLAQGPARRTYRLLSRDVDLEGDFEPLDIVPRSDGSFVDTRAVVQKRFYRVEISLPENE